MAESLGIRHLSRTDSPPTANFDPNDASARFHVKKANIPANHSAENNNSSSKKKGALSRFLKFIKGGKNGKSESGSISGNSTQAERGSTKHHHNHSNNGKHNNRQKSTDSSSSSLSNNINIDNSHENHLGLKTHSHEGHHHYKPNNKPGIARSHTNPGKKAQQLQTLHQAQSRRTISGGAERLKNNKNSKNSTPKRANTISGTKVTKNSTNISTSETVTSDSSSTGYLSDESRRRAAEQRGNGRMMNNSHQHHHQKSSSSKSKSHKSQVSSSRSKNQSSSSRRRKKDEESSEDSTSSSGESYSSSEDSVYSSAEVGEGRNTTQQEEESDGESGSSRSEEITGTGGDTTEMEATQQYALETIPENEDDNDNATLQQALMEVEMMQNMQHIQNSSSFQQNSNNNNHHNSHHSINSNNHQIRSLSNQGNNNQNNNSIRENRLPTRESHHSAHNLEFQIDSDEGSLLDEKIYRKEMSMAMVRKSSDDLSGNGLHKPKPIWRRRTARPMSFQERSTYDYEGNYPGTPTERVRGASFHGKTPVQKINEKRT